MDFNEYQKEALKTASSDAHPALWALGVAGEAGELCELVKKHYGHGIVPDKDKVISEIGDVLWYLAKVCDSYGITLSEAAAANVAKLRKRYPDGFALGGGNR